jgi:hypothetical protein
MFGFFRLAPLILKYFPLKRSSGLVQSNLKTLRPSSSKNIRSPVLGYSIPAKKSSRNPKLYLLLYCQNARSITVFLKSD